MIPYKADSFSVLFQDRIMSVDRGIAVEDPH